MSGMTCDTPVLGPARHAGPGQELQRLALRIWDAFDRWHGHTSRRRALRDLPPRLLADIGLAPDQVPRPTYRSTRPA